MFQGKKHNLNIQKVLLKNIYMDSGHSQAELLDPWL